MPAKLICAIWMATSVVSVPPAQFDHRYLGELTVIVLPSSGVHAACFGVPRTQSRIMACAMLDNDGKKCIIVLPEVEVGIVTLAQQNRLRRHEEGHCNGWLANHFGAVFTFRGGMSGKGGT